jgi:hypothetical protein
LSRKRYAESVKFLKKIITEATGKTHTDLSVQRGLRAVELLLDLYGRFDQAMERRERDDAAKTKQPEAPEAGPVPAQQ